MTASASDVGAARTVRLGGSSYPLVLPSRRDPRLHLAAVILTIHALGVTTLGFEVSVPQIASAILTCALIDVLVTFRRSGRVVWPASAMLTGSGVALILRVIGTERGDVWSWRGWYLFALVAGLSLATKYFIRYRGSHVFNPSNIGLVVVFLALGSGRVEPLDFWWAPLDLWMAGAYAVILAGGWMITRRLRLVAMAVSFWMALAVGLGVLTGSGHCMTAAWSLQPVCGSHFWWVVLTSPEVLIFVFFMLTDPKTIPTRSGARIAFAVAVAVVSTVLIAPQSTEFGAKVGLLAGLALLSPLRPLFDRAIAPRTVEGATPLGWITRPTMRDGGDAPPSLIFGRGLVIGAAGAALLLAVIAAGAPARKPVAGLVTADSPAVEVEILPASLPEVDVSADVAALEGTVGRAPEQVARALAEALAIEAEALRRLDPSILRSANAGERLIEMEQRIDGHIAAGEVVVPMYAFDRLGLDVVYIDGTQGGASLALEAAGEVTEVTYDARGNEQGRRSIRFDTVFVLEPSADGGWLIVDARS